MPGDVVPLLTGNMDSIVTEQKKVIKQCIYPFSGNIRRAGYSKGYGLSYYRFQRLMACLAFKVLEASRVLIYTEGFT